MADNPPRFLGVPFDKVLVSPVPRKQILNHESENSIEFSTNLKDSYIMVGTLIFCVLSYLMLKFMIQVFLHLPNV